MSARAPGGGERCSEDMRACRQAVLRHAVWRGQRSSRRPLSVRFACRLYQALASPISPQSKSGPQNGTNTSCVRPMVITSIACSATAAVGRLSLTATTLVLARLGTNRKLRSPPS